MDQGLVRLAGDGPRLFLGLGRLLLRVTSRCLQLAGSLLRLLRIPLRLLQPELSQTGLRKRL